MKRAAIYARFSTDLQNERSIADQIAVCREFAGKHGCSIVATFEDVAISGASMLNRPGIGRLLAAASRREFDVVIAESMSRISRDQEDRAAIRKRFKFDGVVMMTTADGTVSHLMDGFRSVMDEAYLDDLRRMVWRGLSGNVREGKSGGGRCYGYAVVPGKPGERTIVDDEAAIVRRIFSEYVDGRTAREIAKSLNADRIVPPRGRAWGASTINGNGKRGTGIIRNPLYAGRIAWNKVHMIKDPATGKRISRPNAKTAWQIADVPALAIVERDLFEQAQARKDLTSNGSWRLRRKPKRILSGLLRCGSCGAGMSINGADKSGRVRIRCTGHIERGTCSSPKTYYLDVIETAVLSGLKAEMKRPDVISEYLREYHAERKRLASTGAATRARMETRLGEIRREIDRLVDAIARGHGEPSVLGPRSTALDAERKTLEAQLAEATPPMVVTLHPGALARYREQLEDLSESINRTADPKAFGAIRDLVESVVVRRTANGRPEIEIVGRLNALLGPEAYPNGVRAVCGALVAGRGYIPTPHPIIFRLRAAG